MGNSRRKRQDEIRDQEQVYGMRSDNLRPLHEPLWTRSVPQWEKQFCSMVGSIPWRRFLEMKRYVHLYDNVVNWDDSAGEEAFNDAKTRFWAKIGDLPCDNDAAPLPDPDVYIDNVDWDNVDDDDDDDLDLVLDLETEPEKQARDENPVVLTEALLTGRALFSCSGWGDTEESFERAKESRKPPGIDVAWERSYDCKFNNPKIDAYKASRWYDSRYKVSRFPSNYECHANRAYRERRKTAEISRTRNML